MFPFFKAHTITMKRSSKILVNASKLQTERDKVFAENQAKMLNIIEDLQQTVMRLSSKMDMTEKIDINAFFPIKTDSDLLRFMDKADGNFQYKREAFENMLYCHVTNTIKFRRPFESSLLARIFTREFITSHKWPGQR